ncbi:MAG: 1-acyl-sn-glycerol-3-phosphate acyltransferase [Firmicutes bacterium]|nr:1-acyl-sn-glycerol-3-phosphate acyltransferase [Bacillota bacterium]
MKRKRRKSSAVKKPPAILYIPAALISLLILKLRFGFSVDRSGVRDIKGPALILANHLTNYDHFIVAASLFPHRLTFVLSAHFMMIKPLRPILNRLHVITKRMFDSDAGTVLNMMRAARAGNIIVLFPEGRLTWYPHSLKITEPTGTLVKRLGIDVYRVTANGALLTFPKWSPKSHRGKIRVETEKLLTADEIKTMTEGEIYALISQKLCHDEERAMSGVRYKSRDTVRGLDGVLYRCPECGGEDTLEFECSRIRCSSCGMTAALTEKYRFEGAPVGTINEWYRYQLDAFDTGVPLMSDAVVNASDENGVLIHGAGESKIRLDTENFTFSGTVFGESVSFEIPTRTIEALPLSVSDHFDIYHGGRLYTFSPHPDPRYALRYVMFADLMKEKSD